jgi:hypothetical protein
MHKPFSIKWIYLIERRSFDQMYKFSNKNDMVCAWRKSRKNSCGISNVWTVKIGEVVDPGSGLPGSTTFSNFDGPGVTYDKWNFKPQI